MSLSYEVTRTQLYLQDEQLNFDELTELDDSSIFKIQYKN